MTKFDYSGFFFDRLSGLKKEHRYRTFRNIGRDNGSFPRAGWVSEEGMTEVPAFEDTKKISVWCTNDYLGMGQHPVVLEAMHTALDRYGAGSGGTRNISGTNHEIVALEAELSSLYGKGGALVFSSGYVANETALATLGRLLPGVVFFSDAENHASMIEGIRAGGAEKEIFRHNDVADLRSKLAQYPLDIPKVVLFESVYSMSGAKSCARELIDAAKAFGALVYVDETHAVGVYGSEGAGIMQADGLLKDVDIIQGGLGKGYGVVGGFIAGNAEIVDVIRSYGSGFIFTTSLPPVIAAGARASVHHLRHSQVERTRTFSHVNFLKQELQKRGVSFMDQPSHLIPIMINNAELCNHLAEVLLWEHGMYLQPINYPTVPRGTERFRVCATAAHAPEECTALAEALRQVLDEQKSLNASARSWTM